MAVATVAIAGRSVGDGEPALVIAEAGVNHDGDEGQAERLIDAAAAAGADAVKFQTFTTDALVAGGAPVAEYQRRAGAEQGQAELLAALELPDDAWPRLRERCDRAGVMFLSTPFDQRSLDLLAGLRVPAIKVSSGDIDNTPLLQAIAATGLPVLLSTGMANASDVARALSDLGEAAQRTVLLHCVSAYPAPVESCNLRAIGTLRALYNRPVGFSDHTTGSAAALAAVALGACALEKHLTLDRTLPGPDHAASLEPEELSELVGGVRAIEAALGSPPKRPQPVEQDVRAVARRGVVAARALSAGDLLDPTAIAARRPAAGLPPTELDELVGRRLLRALAPGEPIRWEAVSAQREDDRR